MYDKDSFFEKYSRMDRSTKGLSSAGERFLQWKIYIFLVVVLMLLLVL